MPIELLTTAEMAEADRLAVEHAIESFALMEAAGRAVAEAAQDLIAEGPIVIVAGPGNNGGDGFVAARILAGQGRDVTVALLGDRARLKGDAARAATLWRGAVIPVTEARLDHAALVIDALFGAGLDRQVTGDALAAIRAINDSGAPVLAVDLASGINGTTGAVMGEAVKAIESMTFFRRKPGHLLLPGRIHCGRVRLADIGIPDHVLAAIKPHAFENSPELWRADFPVPQIDAHKYARGHALVVSGDMSATGAARLAARAALRAGAGVATLASPRDALAVNAAALTSVMVRAIDNAEELKAKLADKRITACVIGPGAGIGEATRAKVLAALGFDCALVLDADGLTSFAERPDALFTAIKSRPERPVIMTPHYGEYARLFNGLSQNYQTLSKLEATRIAAAASGAVVVLKGPDSVVAAPDGRAAIAGNAPPWLATAGSGDVLAGICTGLLAQRMPAFEAASAAVWMHGECGHEAGPGLIAEDLSEVMPAVTRRLYDGLDISY